jgi:glycosyltransferase involved in cell wall biosynthesis
VVAYARGGLVEVVADGISGRLVAPGDIDAAAEALRTIGGLDRSTCRAHAQANLNLEDTLDAHEELYEGVLFEADTLSRPRETS